MSKAVASRHRGRRVARQLHLDGVEESIRVYQRGEVRIYHADVLSLYQEWKVPVAIISDGPYGVGGFPGDLPTCDHLAELYEPHIVQWSAKAPPQTTLWFWNTEIGWATVHPLLVKYGWRYVRCNIWDKGIAHVAGNSNTQILRELPVVTEVCVQYVKEPYIDGLNLKDWLRREWERTGLPISKANEACGVANAATRKYLTRDHRWYFPPPEMFEKLVAYANRHGRPEGKPYFAPDGLHPMTADDWSRMRAKFYCKPGITNVWREPPLHNGERLKVGGKSDSYESKTSQTDALAHRTFHRRRRLGLGTVWWSVHGGVGCFPTGEALRERGDRTSFTRNRGTEADVYLKTFIPPRPLYQNSRTPRGNIIMYG